jgi:hypothetical protein
MMEIGNVLVIALCPKIGKRIIRNGHIEMLEVKKINILCKIFDDRNIRMLELMGKIRYNWQ